jgi:ribosomal protein S18 acetylase RimI-like enzyme
MYDNYYGKEILGLGLEGEVITMLNLAMTDINHFAKKSIAKDINPYPFNPEDFKHNRLNEHYFLVFDGKKIVSILSVVYALEHHLKIARIFNVYTLPEYRHKGLAKRNLIAAIVSARSNGYIVQLNVYRSNKAAQKLYKSLKFKPVEYTMQLG